MTNVTARDLPPGALLARYRDSGDYTDCFAVTVPGDIVQALYVEAFYTSFLFKLERLFLTWTVLRPSTDQQARRLAAGEITTFAAWSVEDQQADQILMCDYQTLTRSWLMSKADGAGGTTLYFGSAVVRRKGQQRMGRGFHLLLPMHRLYARALLRSAVRRLESIASPAASA